MSDPELTKEDGPARNRPGADAPRGSNDPDEPVVDSTANRGRAAAPGDGSTPGEGPDSIEDPGTVDAEAASDGGGPEIPADLPPELQEILALSADELLDLKQRADERDLFRDELLRAKAELDNHQKRVRRERPQWEDQAVRRLALALLPVLDNFQLALSSGGGDESSIRQGVDMIYQLFSKSLEDFGIEEIAAEGAVFDPEFHEAIAMLPAEDGEDGPVEDNTVIDVQQRGYLFKGVVVRPSRVIVAKQSTADAPAEEAATGESSDS